MTNQANNDVAAQDPRFSARFAKHAQGRMNASIFLGVEAPVKDAKRLRHWFAVLATQDSIVGKPDAFEHERGEIFTFKSFQCRIPCFRHGDVWFLTHRFIKKRDR